MQKRFPHEKDSQYMREWAERFRNQSEWFHADPMSRDALLKANKKKYEYLEKKGY